MNKRVIALIFVAFLISSSCSILGSSNENGTTLPGNSLPKMALYKSATSPFTIEYPAVWRDVTGKDKRCGKVLKCFASEDDQLVTFRDAKLGDVGGSGWSLAQYIDAILPDFGGNDPGFELVSRQQMTTNSGLTVEILEYTFQDGLIKVKELWCVQDGQAVTVSYITYADKFEKLDPIVDYSFRSLNLK